MSIAASGGPHTVLKLRKTTTFAANKSPIDVFVFVSSITCFVQELTFEETETLSKKNILANGMITFFADPGLVDEKTVFTFSHRGVKEIHEVKGFNDHSGLGRVFTAYTWMKTASLTTQSYPES